MQPVDVLGRVHAGQGLGVVETGRDRVLDQEAVDGTVVVELVDGLQEVLLPGAGRDANVKGADPEPLADLVLAGHVVNAGGVVAHQYGPQADGLARRRQLLNAYAPLTPERRRPRVRRT